MCVSVSVSVKAGAGVLSGSMDEGVSDIDELRCNKNNTDKRGDKGTQVNIKSMQRRCGSCVSTSVLKPSCHRVMDKRQLLN